MTPRGHIEKAGTLSPSLGECRWPARKQFKLEMIGNTLEHPTPLSLH
jgi:hypothetical protein